MNNHSKFQQIDEVIKEDFLFSINVLAEETVVCLSSMCLPITALPEGFHQSVCPHPPAISLDINGQCGRGRGLPSHSKNPTHLSHSELNIAAFSCSDCSCTSAPRTVWWQRTSKGGQRWERTVPD